MKPIMMKPSKRMQAYLMRLAQKHGFNLEAEYAHLRLKNEPYQDFVMQKQGKDTLAIMFIRGSIPDPMIRFYTGRTEWVATDLLMPSYGGYKTQQYAEFDEELNGWKFDRYRQAELASFATNMWHSMTQQNWIEDATVHELAVADETHGFVFRAEDGRVEIKNPIRDNMDEYDEYAVAEPVAEPVTVIESSAENNGETVTVPVITEIIAVTAEIPPRSEHKVYTLKELQEIVDGDIEIIYPFAPKSRNMIAVGDENSMASSEAIPNILASYMIKTDYYDYFLIGDILFCHTKSIR